MKKTDSVFLTWMGVGLSLAHGLTAGSWLFDGFYIHFSPDSPLATCHAFWLSCLQISLPQTLIKVLLVLYGGLSLVAAILFYFRKNAFALLALWILTLFKFASFILRFNVMGNYHLLHFFMSFIFLCLPQKRFSLHIGLIYLYILAGMLKLNPEWLSGAALTSRPLISGKWLSLSLGYVFVLEVILVWGLLSNRAWIRAVTLLQLMLFHLFSWHIVGYYYPLTMACLLLPFIIDLFDPAAEPLNWRQVSPALLAVLFVSFLFQVRPLLSSRDPALTGRFRSFRINMLDARPQCSALAFIQQGSLLHSLNLISLNSLRTRCDTSVFETQLYRYCHHLEPGTTLRYLLYSKRDLDEKFQIIEDTQDVCRRYRP